MFIWMVLIYVLWFGQGTAFPPEVVTLCINGLMLVGEEGCKRESKMWKCASEMKVLYNANQMRNKAANKEKLHQQVVPNLGNIGEGGLLSNRGSFFGTLSSVYYSYTAIIYYGYNE